MKEQIIAILKDFKHGKISVDTAECQIEAAIAKMPTEEEIIQYFNNHFNCYADYMKTAGEMEMEVNNHVDTAMTIGAVLKMFEWFRNRMSKPNNFTGMESLECDCPESDRMHMPDNEPDVCTKCGKKFN
jgi:hypothetical protein